MLKSLIFVSVEFSSSNYAINMFESLSKPRTSYAYYFLYKMDSKAGKTVCRKHAHTHT
ncbi:hypothetical protein CY34DRAFT_146176 [Suillus luteus UH-Slu-Lm8-n1]|uniref:Uncharacterized protein n=1 Tax=Suillus luteus UH-Slu-Lm8-n1 TaxID=930992 RepID=A0A0D0BGR6_9AGAM|nr:hypothetical protein CY34DRAFT_146176 [Suillus luteus UH-Slu-Lm8-n1]